MDTSIIPTDYITRNKESTRDPSPASSTQSLGDREAINHPESMDGMAAVRDTVAYLVASTIDGKSAGQLYRSRDLFGDRADMSTFPSGPNLQR